MYQHPQTAVGEFPRTAREILHHSFALLEQRFPERTLPVFGASHIPAYSWEGAGSERGGTAGDIEYQKLVFVPYCEGQTLVTSLGDARGDFTSGGPSNYSVLAVQKVSDRLAELLLAFYREKLNGRTSGEGDSSLTYPLHELLEQPMRSFRGVPVFAFDDESRSLLYANKRHSIDRMYRVQDRTAFEVIQSFYNNPDLGPRVGLAQSFAHALAACATILPLSTDFPVDKVRSLDQFHHVERLLHGLWNVDPTLKLDDGLDEKIRSSEARIKTTEATNKELQAEMEAALLKVRVEYGSKMGSTTEDKESIQAAWQTAASLYSLPHSS